MTDLIKRWFPEVTVLDSCKMKTSKYGMIEFFMTDTGVFYVVNDTLCKLEPYPAPDMRPFEFSEVKPVMVARPAWALKTE